MANDYYVKLSDIYNDFLLTIEDSDYISSVNPMLVWTTMKRGAREFSLDVHAKLRTKNLTIGGNNTVDIPTNAISVTKVGFVDSDGLIYQLVENKNHVAREVSDAPTAGFSGTTTSEEGLNDIVFHNYLLDGNYGQIYGMGGGKTHGTYTMDYPGGKIQLDTSTNATEVFVEYLEDMATMQDPEVHVFAEEPIRLYTYYKLIQSKSNVPGGEKARARKEYFNELRRANSRFTTFNKQEAMSISRKNFRLSPKS
tara:strand:+ start:454 stop:1212 length:759 start_codon:yes stop_codon:yes gene_type:complete